MLTSRTRFIAAIFVGGLSLASCGGGGGSSQMTPLVQSNQLGPQTKIGGAHCTALPLINPKTQVLGALRRNAALSGCGIRSSHRISSLSQAGSLQVFDVPAAIKVSKCTSYELFNVCGTFGIAINASGTIAGYYNNSNHVVAAFIRTAGGTYRSFQAPGATGLTLPYEITNAGAIVGQYPDAGFVLHGFLRRKNGGFLTYEAPWASQIPNDSVSQGTAFGAINAAGETGGIYFDAQGVLHGYLRYRNGTAVQIVPKGSTTSTVCLVCLNNSGTAAGNYSGSDGIVRGYIRSAAGAIRTIAKPGALETVPSGLNNGNRVLGFYVDKNSVVWGFIVGGNKRRIVFQDPKASTTYGNGTQPEAINDAGAVTGLYADAQGDVHGFYRSPTGRFSEFDPTGSVYTLPFAINASGTVTGYWYDAQGGNHGFIWTPQ